ncbi:MAG: potassium transporter Kef [Thaumarchaeota archaeon]|nr:potassium transporter Kef [Nitrososphaerota archaeon]
MTVETELIRTIIAICLFLFAAKLLAEGFHRAKLPIVLGELVAGMIIGPFALGGLPLFNGEPLIVLNESIRVIGEIGAIVILFIGGLHVTPREFFKGGIASFTVGSIGVIIPFFVGYYVFTLFGFEALQSMLVATALTATSIAISIQVLSHLGKLQAPEAKLILGAAIVDDILALAVLSVVTSMVQTGATVNPIEIAFLIMKVLGFFAVLLIASIVILPKVIARADLWKAKGSVEAVSTAAFFGIAALAALIGLSPIVGAFAAGMALASTPVLKRLEEYVGKLEFIFAPLFFAIIGAQVNLTGLNVEVLLLGGIIIAIAIVTKIVGCGLPAMLFLKNKNKSMKVGVVVRIYSTPSLSVLPLTMVPSIFLKLITLNSSIGIPPTIVCIVGGVLSGRYVVSFCSTIAFPAKSNIASATGSGLTVITSVPSEISVKSKAKRATNSPST